MVLPVLEFEIKHRKDAKHQDVDALSRREIDSHDTKSIKTYLPGKLYINEITPARNIDVAVHQYDNHTSFAD